MSAPVVLGGQTLASPCWDLFYPLPRLGRIFRERTFASLNRPLPRSFPGRSWVSQPPILRSLPVLQDVSF